MGFLEEYSFSESTFGPYLARLGFCFYSLLGVGCALLLVKRVIVSKQITD